MRIEEPRLDVFVDRPLRDAAEQLRVGAHDVPYGLFPQDAGREHLVHRRDPFVVRMDSAA